MDSLPSIPHLESKQHLQIEDFDVLNPMLTIRSETVHREACRGILKYCFQNPKKQRRITRDPRLIKEPQSGACMALPEPLGCLRLSLETLPGPYLAGTKNNSISNSANSMAGAAAVGGPSLVACRGEL